MKDIFLTQDAIHDLDISNYDLTLVDQRDEIEQNIKVRLLFFKGEWFLDTSVGVPYYTDILIKTPIVTNVDNIIKAEIVSVPGVVEILEYESDFDKALRKFTVDFTVDTDYGLITKTEIL